MATNITRYLQANFALPVVVTNPTSPVTGDPVRYGELTGVAITDEGEGGNAATETTVEFGAFIGNFSVKGVDDSGNSAVAAGDTIFYVDADTPKLSKKASGYMFGFAIGTVSSGGTSTIAVLHAPAGSWVGSVATGDIAAGAVTAAKLSTTLKTGFINIGLTGIREVASNNLGNVTANGGLLATDTTPILEFTNGDTDSAWRMRWASSNSDPISFQCALPPDIDEASNVTVNLLAAMGGATDTPVISADTYFNVGDTKVEDDSAAISGTTVAEYAITVAAADVPAGAQTMTVELTPGAHTTDTLLIYAVWVEYTRA